MGGLRRRRPRGGRRGRRARSASAIRAIGLLVNYAGIPGRSSFLRSDPETIEQIVRINYLGSVWCLRAFLPALEAGVPSHVVNVVSVAGTVAVGRAGPYSAAKHAQLAFSRSLAAELRPRGDPRPHVNPGFVETEGFPQAQLRSSRLRPPRSIEPELVAERIVAAVERGPLEIFVPRWYRPSRAGPGARPGHARARPGRDGAAERGALAKVHARGRSSSCTGRAARRTRRHVQLLDEVLAERGHRCRDPDAPRYRRTPKPRSSRFPGSPTIRVDGRDVDPAAQTAAPRSPAASTTCPTAGSSPSRPANNWRPHCHDAHARNRGARPSTCPASTGATIRSATTPTRPRSRSSGRATTVPTCWPGRAA